MCKYCEGVKNGGARIIFDPEDVGYILQADEGCTYAITYCPWCGRELPLPEEETKFSPEKKIAILEERINHTNKMLEQLIMNLQDLLICPGKIDTWNQVLRRMNEIRRKI